MVDPVSSESPVQLIIDEFNDLQEKICCAAFCVTTSYIIVDAEKHTIEATELADG